MRIDDFINAKFKSRTEFIEIPELKDWFDEGEKVGVEIRGLSGNEWARIQSGSRQEIQRVAYDLLSANNKDIANAIKNMLGGGDIQEDTERRICYFESALVYPDLNAEQKMRFAAKLNERFPFDFLRVTNKVIELTGAGQCPEG